jgi:hypothetical protein
VAHERHIDHRHFVGDQKVSFQGTAFVARKSARDGLDFQQAVDCLGLDAGRLREPLGGSTRESAQKLPTNQGKAKPPLPIIPLLRWDNN